MKRVLCLLLFLSMFLSGCGMNTVKKAFSKTEGSTFGIWISFSEMDSILNSEKGIEEEVSKLIENLNSLKIKNVYLHIRSHADSLFESEYYPKRESVKKYDFDVFEYFIKELHKSKIKVHAWINPYRVSSSTEDINLLDQNSPAYKWLTDQNTENDINVSFSNGIYFNPASNEARSLIIKGVREVVEKYDIDGISFDDYFYPTTQGDFDSESYASYLETAENPLSLEDWRRVNVNSLISGVSAAIKAYDRDIVFSVSPAADIDKNYSSYYADVRYWVKSGFVDEIIPQLYFGFDYPDEKFRFKNLVKEWENVISDADNVKLSVGLAAYKISTLASPDNEEWSSNDDIIARQAEYCIKNSNISGCVLFSYSATFSENGANTKERNNLKRVIEKY